MAIVTEQWFGAADSMVFDKVRNVLVAGVSDDEQLQSIAASIVMEGSNNTLRHRLIHLLVSEPALVEGVLFRLASFFLTELENRRRETERLQAEMGRE